jgi:hypothetical protein
MRQQATSLTIFKGIRMINSHLLLSIVLTKTCEDMLHSSQYIRFILT